MNFLTVDQVSTHRKGFAFKSKNLFTSGTPIVQISDFDESFVKTTKNFLNGKIDKGLFENWKLETNDILISTVGSWESNPRSVVGKAVLIDKYLKGALLNQNIVRLRSIKNFDQIFLYYCFKTKKFRDHCISSAQGSGNQASITLKDIQSFEIPNLKYSDQINIGKILKTFDQKILSNENKLQIYYDTIKFSYKSWFLNYDLYNENKKFFKINTKEKQLNLIDSNLGKIPKGWSVKKIGDISIKQKAKIKDDMKTPRVFSAIKTGELVLSDEYFSKKVYSKSIKNYYLVDKFTFAYNPSRINIGSIGLNCFDFCGAVSPAYNVFKVEKHLIWFFQEWLRLNSTRKYINSICFGSVRQSLDHSAFEQISIVIPPREIIDNFNKIYEKYLVLKKKLIDQNQVLTKLKEILIKKYIY